MLDVGCGNGYGSLLVAEVARRVVGIDVESAWSDHQGLGEDRPAHVEFARLPAERMWDTFAVDDFDVVLAIEVLEHLADPEHLLRNLSIFRQSGKVIFITVPNDSVNFRSRVDSNPHHVSHFSLESFVDITSSYLGPPSDIGGGHATFGFSALPMNAEPGILNPTKAFLTAPVDSWASVDEAHFWYAVWGGVIPPTQVSFPAGETAAALAYDIAAFELPARVATDHRCIALERTIQSLRIENEELRSRLWAAAVLFESSDAGAGQVLADLGERASFGGWLRDPPSWAVTMYLGLPNTLRVPIAKVRRFLVSHRRS